MLPDEGRELFEKKADCEDSADELAAKIFEDGGAAYRSCAEAKEAGWCPEYLERHLELANMYGEMNHRQLKKIC